ncbi:hypothetical protein NL465_27455, partial [Klebsiella pneumoniae]|nr:hypothetical protein [Klebsiella pneumoniae]
KRAYCLKTQPATGETYPKSDLFNKAYIWHNIENCKSFDYLYCPTRFEKNYLMLLEYYYHLIFECQFQLLNLANCQAG